MDYSVVINNAVSPFNAESFGGTSSLDFSQSQAAGSPRNLLLGVVNNSFTYNPSLQGAISSIAASVFKQLSVTNPNDVGPVTIGSTFRVLVEQGGSFYEAAIPGTPVSAGANSTVTGSNEHLFNNSLSASDFMSIDVATGIFGPLHPNFATGTAIDFGIVQFLGAAPTPPLAFSDVGSYTDLTLTISSVPLPASAPLFGAGLLALAAVGYGAKGKRKAASHA